MGRVNGNIQGIKDTLLERIELLYDMRQGQDEFVSREMAELSQLRVLWAGRASVYIGRDGRMSTYPWATVPSLMPQHAPAAMRTGCAACAAYTLTPTATEGFPEWIWEHSAACALTAWRP